jgi:hypothetical protein
LFFNERFQNPPMAVSIKAKETRFMRRPKLAFLALTTALAASSACRPEDNEADEFRKGIPNKQTVEVQVPGSTGQALSVADQGQTSEYYKLTRTVSRDVNSGVYFVLTLVREVVKYPPSNVSENTAVWGPFSEPLDPIAWKVTVNRTATNEYAYKFEGQAKNSPLSAFETVLSGVHRPGLGSDQAPLEGFGEGSFLLDFDARNRLPLPDKDVGTAAFSYSKPSLNTPVKITAKFTQVKDDDRPGHKVDVDYRYLRNIPGNGELEFSFKPDAAAILNGPAQFDVMSRWTTEGSGRSDVTVSGGTLAKGTKATANECWNTAFASVFVQTSWDTTLTYGTEAMCAFPTATYATLML